MTNRPREVVYIIKILKSHGHSYIEYTFFWFCFEYWFGQLGFGVKMLRITVIKTVQQVQILHMKLWLCACLCWNNKEYIFHLLCVTGGNTGIGKATAAGLAMRGARVILACRSKQRGEAAAQEIRTVSESSDLTLIWEEKTIKH